MWNGLLEISAPQPSHSRTTHQPCWTWCIQMQVMWHWFPSLVQFEPSHGPGSPEELFMSGVSCGFYLWTDDGRTCGEDSYVQELQEATWCRWWLSCCPYWSLFECLCVYVSVCPCVWESVCVHVRVSAFGWWFSTLKILFRFQFLVLKGNLTMTQFHLHQVILKVQRLTR